MRVAAKLDSAPSSCELFADGEVEDYILNITSSGNIRLKDITQNVDTLSVYPNPTTGLVTVEYSEGINEISLYDLAGRKVLQAKTDDSGKTEIDLSNYSEGVYFLCTDKGQTQKIIKLD
jgi:hypothetical protein